MKNRNIITNSDNSIVQAALDAYKQRVFSIPRTELNRRLKISLNKKMPHGPVGGKPLSSTMLTFRTGRFSRSIDVYYNYQQGIIFYFYNPIYYVHEKTNRDPRKLIESSIRTVIARLTGQKVKIIKGS